MMMMVVKVGLLRMRTEDELDLGMDEIDLMRQVEAELGLQLLNDGVERRKRIRVCRRSRVAQETLYSLRKLLVCNHFSWL